MEHIIKEMVEKAEYYNSIGLIDEARDMLRFVRDLINKMCSTYNCPSNWKYIGETLEKEYEEGSFVYEELELCGFVD